MMENIRKRGTELAERKVEQQRAEIKSVLITELDDDATVSQTCDGLVVQAKRLGEKLIENSNLRDVAFLMRGIR